MLEVSDDGVGMDAETVKRAFEPFFTTWSDAGGTGLGLAVVKSIVADHGGTVAVESEPAKGARFAVQLPVTPEMTPTGLDPVETVI